MTNMVLQVPMVASVAEQVVLVALMVLVWWHEDIFSSFFGGGASRNPNAPRQGMTSISSISSLKKRFLLGAEKESSTIRKLAAIPVIGSG